MASAFGLSLAWAWDVVGWGLEGAEFAKVEESKLLLVGGELVLGLRELGTSLPLLGCWKT